MSAFTLPLSVRDGDRVVRMTLRLARPLSWSAVHPHVCRAARMPADTVLFHGVGAVENSWLVGSPPLLAGSVLSTAPDDETRVGDPLTLAVIGGPDAGREHPLSGAAITIGRSGAADLRLTDPAASWLHASITPAATGLMVTDLGSTNGVHVDGAPVRRAATAVTGSVIRIGNSAVQIQLTAEPSGSFRADGHGHVVRTGRPPALPPAPPAAPPRPIEPDTPPHRSLPLLSALIGATVGGGLAIVLRNPLYLAFAAFGPATMIGTAVSDRLRGRRSLRRRRRDFRRALAQWQPAAHAAGLAQRRHAWQQWPGPAELVRRAEAGGVRVWDRPVGGLAVSVGFFTCRPASAPAASPPVSADKGRSAEVGQAAVSDAPAPITLVGVIGFVGATARGVARYVIAQLCCCFSPNDLTLMVLTDHDDLAACQDLPHAHPVGRFGASGDGAEPVETRRTVVVLDGPPALRSTTGAAALRSAGAGVTVLCLAATQQDLPPQAVDVTAAATGTDDRLLTLTSMPGDLLTRLCHAVAPLRDQPTATTGMLPDTVDLIGLTGPIDAVRLRNRWRSGSGRATLGYGAGGAIELNLAADGPHLLIAGTTGSGKSELLQTFIASLAIDSSPQAVTFLLVDYKGGAAFGAIAELPHVVGVLTDLDPAGSARALASLRAELRRRERLQSEGAPRPAKLVVVIDEFATLAVELPEFLSGMLDIAQRGRSLGLHLVVATQRPAGVVSPAMRANISARICLRVTDPADSLDVIGVPDAATLPAHCPGRAIAKLSGATTLFQAARVSQPPPAEVVVTTEIGQEPDGSDAADDDPTATHTMLRIIVDAARAAASDMPAAARPWLPPLPPRIAETETSAPAVFAVADLPDQQCRQEFAAPDVSTLVVGPPQSGRSTTLRRLALLAAREQQELIVIDGGDGLADMQEWAAVSTYLTARRPRLVMRALALLADPSRRPRDGHLRHIIVDHLDLVVAELERTDYSTGGTLLPELLSRAGGSIRITAAGPERLRHQRIAAGFREVIELGGAGAEQGAGRGTWSGRVIQVVDAAAASAPASAAVSLVDRTIVRRLPSVVHISQLPDPTPAAVPFALGGDAGDALAVDLASVGGGIVVAGPRRSGVTTTLEVLAAQAARAGIAVMWASAGGSAAPPGTAEVGCPTAPDDLAEALRAHHGPLLLVSDHDDDHPAATIFELFLAVCGPGQNFLAGARIDTLLRTRRGYLSMAASFRRGLLLSPDQTHGSILDVPLPKRSGPVVPGRGIWVWDGVAQPAQIARPSRGAAGRADTAL